MEGGPVEGGGKLHFVYLGAVRGVEGAADAEEAARPGILPQQLPSLTVSDGRRPGPRSAFHRHAQ